MADATRDLERRVLEFQNVVKQQIGGERFAEFSARQQAALTSIAYNYGKLPDRIVEAVKHGTNGQIAAAVRGLAATTTASTRAPQPRSRHPRHAQPRRRPGRCAGARRHREGAPEDPDAVRREAEGGERHSSAGHLAAAGSEGSHRRRAPRRAEARVHRRRDPEEGAGDCQAQRRARSAGKPLIVFTAGAGPRSGSRRRLLRPRARQGCGEQRARCCRQAGSTDLGAQRDALEQRIQFLRENGDAGMARELLPTLDAVNDKLREAIANQIKFWQEVMAAPMAAQRRSARRTKEFRRSSPVFRRPECSRSV
jgi:hypothetical protein